MNLLVYKFFLQIENRGNERDRGYQQGYCSDSLTETEDDESFDSVSVASSAFEITILYDADFAEPFELPVVAEDAVEDIDVTRTEKVQISNENVKTNNNNNESMEEDERNYENYDAASLDSKSAFAPSCNFIFDENGVEDSVLDACLDYNSSEYVAGEEQKYENYDAVSLDSKSAFAPSCNFIFGENGVEGGVLDACLDYNSNEPVAEEEQKYENYDAVSLESNCAFVPSCNFLLSENGIEDSVLDNCLDALKEDNSEEVSIEDGDRRVDPEYSDNGDSNVDEEERIRKLRAEIREMNGETDDDWKYLTDESDDEEEIAARVAALDFGEEFDKKLNCDWLDMEDSDGEGGIAYFTEIAKRKRRRNKPWNRVKRFFTEKLDNLKWGCESVRYHFKKAAVVFFYKHLHWRLHRYGRYHWV